MAWRLAKSLDRLRHETLARWPGTTIWTIGDAAHRGRGSDHNPNAVEVVCATDTLGREKARVIWDHIMSTRDDRVKYMIFDRQIVSSTVSPWKVRRYNGSNPHSSHIHVSVGRGPSGRSNDPHRYDDDSPWGLGVVTPTPNPEPEPKPPTDDEFWRQEVIETMQTLDLRNAHRELVRGPDVKRLQGLLMAWGFGPEGLVAADGRPDGIAGPGTAKMVEDYQRFRKVTADRIVGATTWSELLTGY